MDAIYNLAKNVIDVQYDSLPRDVVEATKKQIMDAFATAIAGSSAPPVGELVEIYKEWGGKTESTVWVYGEKLPGIVAAQINATMQHARDFDDTHDVAVLHPGAVSVPTAFAVAEMIENVNGRDLITAVALGVDLVTRLCLACTNDYIAGGWHFTPLHGSFSTTAIAGKLMGLDLDTLVNAFGIAYHQTGGNLQCVDDGALTKRCGPGFSNRNGILAAVMAQKGITGATNVLQGPRGLFKQYHRGAYNPEVITKDLGLKFEGVDVSFKPYPCCRYNHAAIDATIDLMKENSIKVDDIDSVVTHIGSSASGLLAEPIEIKQNPRNQVDTQFSLPWAIASTIVHGKVTLADITQKAIEDKEVIAVSNKITAIVEKELCIGGIEPVVVDIKAKDGKLYSKRVNTPYGSPENPMSMDALATKLREAVPFAEKPLEKEKVEKLIDLVADVENVTNIQEVINVVT